MHKSGHFGSRMLRVVVRQKRDDVTGGWRKLRGVEWGGSLWIVSLSLCACNSDLKYTSCLNTPYLLTYSTEQSPS